MQKRVIGDSALSPSVPDLHLSRAGFLELKRVVMTPFPHRYSVVALGSAGAETTLAAAKLTPMTTASPPEFGGPGDRWSPEALLVGAVAGCFVLTFRAVADASKLPWTALGCEAHGTLDRVDRVPQFTAFEVRAHLTVPEGTDVERALRLLEKAERQCLIANSLKAPVHLDATVEAGGTAARVA